MISFVICSIKPELSNALSKNIEETIGDTTYELLIHDNREACWGLAKVYNHYANKAKGDILCFSHEDVEIRSQKWGSGLSEFINSDPNIGVIGFAGYQIKTKHISGWVSDPKFVREYLIQRHNNGKTEHVNINPNNLYYDEVLVLDGLAMICKRDIWAKHPFDEITFNHFHFYDVDFSLEIAQNYKNYVCFTIELEHFSEGSYKSDWYQEAGKFNEKWKQKLPCAISSISRKNIQKNDIKSAYKEAKRDLKMSISGRGKWLIFKEHWLNGESMFYSIKLIKHIIFN